MKTQLNTIRHMARMNTKSAKRSTRCIRRVLRVRKAQYELRQEIKNRMASVETMLSAAVSERRIEITTRSKPMTVRHTPTMAADTVKM